MYRDRHYSSKCHVNHNCIYVARTGTDITIRYAMYAISQFKTWGMYRDRHYSNLKCLSTEQLLRTFEVPQNFATNSLPPFAAQSNVFKGLWRNGHFRGEYNPQMELSEQVNGI